MMPYESTNRPHNSACACSTPRRAGPVTGSTARTADSGMSISGTSSVQKRFLYFLESFIRELSLNRGIRIAGVFCSQVSYIRFILNTGYLSHMVKNRIILERTSLHTKNKRYRSIRSELYVTRGVSFFNFGLIDITRVRQRSTLSTPATLNL